MSWSQYWEWKTPIADADKFAAWSRDIAYLHKYMNTPGVRLPREIPIFVRDGKDRREDFEGICSFLTHTWTAVACTGRYGKVYYDDPLPFPPTVVRGPEGMGEPIFTPTQVTFNGDHEIRDGCEDFHITLDHLKAPHHDGIRTNMHSYDILVRCALARLCHYFPTVRVSSDYDKIGFMIPVAICRHVFEDNNIVPLWSHDFADEDE